MKQKIAKRVMAFMLTAALVFPGSYADVFAEDAGSAGGGTEVVSEELAIRNPGGELNAYIGQPFSFYVRAEGATSYEVDLGEELGAEDRTNKPTLDAATGKFTWTPAAADEGKTYTVTVTAKRGDETVSREVEIFAGYANKKYKTAYLTVEEDASVETWSSSNRNNDCYNDNFLRVMRGNIGDPSSEHPLGSLNNGEMGEKKETEDGTDLTSSSINFEYKLSMMKFNLTDLADPDVDETHPIILKDAKLSLIYLSFRAYDRYSYGSEGGEENLRVVKAPSNDWSEKTSADNKLTWKRWVDMNETANVTYGNGEGESPIKKSEKYTLTAPSAVGTNNGHSAANFAIGGNRVLVDVSDFVQEALSEEADSDGNQYFSLAMTNENGTQHHFISREGANFYTAVKERNIEHAAPTIFMNYEVKKDVAAIEGADSLYLAKGYAATETDSFAVAGTTEPAPISMAEGSNIAGGKITWNAKNQVFEIAEGIAPGVYPLSLEATVNKQKVTKDFMLYVTGSLTAPKFTNPAKGEDGTAVVSACAGSPVSFTVKAEMDEVGECVTSILVDEGQMEALTGASFDEATGVFTWTPSAEMLGTEDSKDYPIMFIAYGSNGIPAEHTVTIHVSRAVQMEEDPNYIAAVKDGYIKSWSTEWDEYSNNSNLLYVICDLNNQTGKGLLGEANDPHDVKLGILQFDLSDFEGKEFSRADLELTYITTITTGQAGRWGDQSICLDVATVPGFTEVEWPLTWRKWNAWRVENNYSTSSNNVQRSKVAIATNPNMVATSSANNASFSDIDGTKVRTDISKFLKEAIANGEEKLTLIFNTTDRGPGNYTTNSRTFCSIKGAGENGYTNVPEGVTVNPPAIFLKSYADDAAIEGPDSITLTEGYQDTFTDSFTVPSYDMGDPDITAISPEEPDADTRHLEKLTWDHDNSRIKVKAGLTAGGQDSASYQAKLSHEGFEKTFTVIVNANKKTELGELKTEFEKNIEGNISSYTSESAAAYLYILGVLEKALEADTVSAATLKGAQDLVDTFDETALVKLDAEYLTKQIEPYKDGVYTSAVYTTATWNPYKTALDEAEALSNYTEADLIEKISALKEAHGKLAVDSESAAGQLYNLVQDAKEMMDNAAIYDEADINTLKGKLQAAEEELKKETPGSLDTLKSELEAAMQIDPLLDKMLDAEIAKAIKDVQAESAYTKTSWAGYKTALDEANALKEDEALTQEKITAVVSKLQTAVGKLVTLTDYRASEVAKITATVDNDANYYVPADWTAYEAALAAVNGLSGSALTEDALNTKIADLSAKAKALNDNKKDTKTKVELKALIDSITKSDYTTTSWTAQDMDSKLAVANTAYNKANATVREISAAWDALNTAKGQLAEGEFKFADLSRLIQEAEQLNGKEAEYTEETWGPFAASLVEAKKITVDSTNEAIVAAYKDLLAKKGALDKVSNDKSKDELDELVQGVKDQINGADGAEKIDPSDYTEENYKKLTDAIEAAEKLNENSTQEEINDAYAAIEAALEMPKISAADVAALAEKVKGMNLKESDWDAASYKALLDAIAEAEKTASGEDGAKTAKEAYNALKAAYGALKKAENPDTPGTGDNGNGNVVIPDPSALTVGATVSDDKDAAPAGSKAEYTVVDAQARTVILKKGKDEATVNVPAAISVGGKDCTVIGIGDKAFISAKKLKKLTIADTVTSIGNQAFSGAKKLSSVKIGTGVTSIGSKAFFNCKKLSKLEIRAKGLKTVKSNAFKGTKKNIVVTLKGIKGKQKTKIKNLLLKKGKMSKGAKIK